MGQEDKKAQAKYLIWQMGHDQRQSTGGKWLHRGAKQLKIRPCSSTTWWEVRGFLHVLYLPQNPRNVFMPMYASLDLFKKKKKSTFNQQSLLYETPL